MNAEIRSGLKICGASFSDLFAGSGRAAGFWNNTIGSVSNAAAPEIGQQVALSSDVGVANKQTAYKIAFSASVVAGPNSADIYSINTITHGYGGTHLVTGIESDVNNVGADATLLESPTAVYGFVAVAAGQKKSTAAYWAVVNAAGGGTPGWQHGFAVSHAWANSFYDKSSAVVSLRIEGTHVTGIDMLNASIAVCAIGLPNNAPVIQRDNTSALRNILKLNANNVLEIGYSGGAVRVAGRDLLAEIDALAARVAILENA